MAYRLDPTRSTAVELRRVLAEQLDGASGELRVEGGVDAHGIHQARKHLKKARSLLRLARADFGKRVVSVAQAELRSAAAVLSGARNADSLVEIADHLIERADDTDQRAAVDRLRVVLAARAEGARTATGSSPGAVTSAARTIEATAAWLRAAQPAAEGWPAVEPGLRREYQRGRVAFADLAEQPTVDELHEWRKRVKDLWYHLRLVRPLWPEAIKPLASVASDLADRLGTDHDLGLLATLLGDEADGPAEPRRLSTELDEADANRVAGLIADERARLQADARRLGSLLYVDSPDAWSGRLGMWWMAALTDELADPSPEEGAA